MDFWAQITNGYKLIKKGDYDQVIHEVTKLKKLRITINEKLALSALEAWALLFAKKFYELIVITNDLIKCDDGKMPSWYRGLGYLLRGLTNLNSTTDNQLDYFQKAADNYQIHINHEIDKISTPPSSIINTAISTYFYGMCILEMTGSAHELVELEKNLISLQIEQHDNPITNILEATRIQVQLNNNTSSDIQIEDILDFENNDFDPLYYINLILRYDL